MKRDAKIASLPQPVREQVNRRLQNGEATAQIAAWLNNLPEARDLMAAEFAGATIKKTDLAGWKLGGYRNWEAQQEALEAAAQFGQDAAEIARADGGQLADHLALCLTARLAVALRRLVGQADVEDGIHHARHGELRPGPDADEQRVSRIAELAAYRRFQLVQVVRDFLVEAFWRGALLQVVAARLGGDNKSGRYWQADIGHLGQVGTLAS